jgi:two-component system response regulator AtoC
LSRGDEIDAADLALPLVHGMEGQDKAASAAATTLEEAEKMLIVNALKQSGGNASEAARLLGITRMTIRYRMEKHGLKDA